MAENKNIILIERVGNRAYTVSITNGVSKTLQDAPLLHIEQAYKVAEGIKKSTNLRIEMDRNAFKDMNTWEALHRSLDHSVMRPN